MRSILATALLTVLLVTSASAEELTGTLAQIKKSGAIRIGYRNDAQPMSFLGKDGVPAGYSIDICKLVVAEVEKKINKPVKIEYVPVTAAERFKALADRKIDIICGNTSRTISRGQQVDFTLTTFVTGAGFMTLKDTQIMNNFNGKKVGVVKGTTTADALRDLFKETGVAADVVLMDTTKEGISALEEKKIDAFTGNQVVLIGQAQTSGDSGKFSLLPNLFTFEPLALAVRKNDSDFRLVADGVIAGLFRTKKIIPIYDKWFGEFSGKVPSAFQALIQINAIPE